MFAYTLFDTIYRLIPVPCLLLLPNEPYFTVTEANDAYLTRTRQIKEDLIGRSFFDYFKRFKDADMSDDEDALRRAVNERKTTETGIHRYYFAGLDNHKPNEQYFKAINVPVISADNEVICIIHVVLDQTETVWAKETRESFKRDLQETSLLMSQGQELANFGNWQWDVNNNVVTWSETLYSIYGLDKSSFKATFEGYQELLHPEDRQRVYELIGNVLQTRKDVVFEERIIRPGGELRYLRSWGKVQVNENGEPFKMIGACLDITESKLAEDKLRTHIAAIEQQNRHLQDIAWQQSHVMRAPIVRILGLVDVLKNYNADEINLTELLNNIAASANELDEIIKDISTKTENLLMNN